MELDQNGAAELDPQLCYEALKSRDRRFDGRFFTGVVTTGIYCRPVCPAPTPKATNVRFFASAAAAEAAGHRPCLRCRPETSPGTPAWLGSSATTSRALRLISDGILDESGVDDLAGRLGIGGRQLRRLFVEHLGASPLAIAKARRVHFARSLLDQTDLSAADVAFSAGFGSVRQFNHAMRATFGCTPTQLRRRRRRRAEFADSGLELRLPYRPPLDAEAVLRFLAGRAIPGVEVVAGGRYVRSIESDGVPGILELVPDTDAGHVLLRLQLERHDGLIAIVDRARRIFDLGADPRIIAEHLSADPMLRPMVTAAPGLRVPGAWDPFEVAVRAVLGQQISVVAATKLSGRLVAAFGTRLDNPRDDEIAYLFPRPEVLAGADLASLGMTRSQARAINGLASEVAAGSLELDSTRGLDEAVDRLCRIDGIGPWTAHYIAMRAFGEPDAFPASDLGLRKAASGDGIPVAADRLEALSETWRPWRAYAAMHLWAQPVGGSVQRKDSR